MQVELTRDAERMLVMLYEIYLSRRNGGKSKQEARRFDADFFSTTKPFVSMHRSDISDSRLELGQCGLLRNFIGGDCELTTPAIIYLENRFTNNVVDVLSFLSQFIP